MTLALQRRALQVMEEALDQPEDTRSAWLDAICGDDTLLKDAVTRLLDADAFAPDVLPTIPPEPARLVDLPPPERIGPYRLGRRLGRGGMGEVFLGQRDDGVFNQTVAIKLLRPSLFPTASERYFDSERRLLASLKHPGIARIIDGGVEPGGRPCFIMERVEGESIDAWVAARTCTPAQVGDLVRQLSRAVQHAHQSLVVHADIKPSNVMIDGGTPRLLDFGIACLVDDEAEHDSAAAFPITPAFASPQRLAGARPTTSDDVFALGALLSALTEDMPRPADLTAIIARATDPSPARRYATAAALADDLERWAANLPIAARPHTALYLLDRLFRRRRWLVIGSALGTLAMVGATVAITALYFQAQEARSDAEQRFTDARHMARYLLFDVYDRLERTPQSLTIRGDVANVGQAYLISLSRDRRASSDVRLEAVTGLTRLAMVQSSPSRGLGRTEAARANLHRAAALAAELARAEPQRADIAVAAAEIRLQQARMALFVDNSQSGGRTRLAEAQAYLRQALTLSPGNLAARQALIQWRILQSQTRQAEGAYAAAAAEGRAAVAVWQALPPAQRNLAESRLRAASAYSAIAEALYYGGDVEGSIAPYRQALDIIAGLQAADPLNPDLLHQIALARYGLGTTYLQLNRAEDGLTILRPGLENALTLRRFDSSDEVAQRMTRMMQNAIGQGLTALRRHGEAIALLTAGVEERRATLMESPGQGQAMRDVAVGLTALGDAYAAAGRTSSACETYRQAQAQWDEMSRRGVLAQMDTDYAVRLLHESVRNACSARP